MDGKAIVEFIGHRSKMCNLMTVNDVKKTVKRQGNPPLGLC